MTFSAFDPFKTKLLKNINLIEASAGTGKTFSIAMLVLRFIVEKKQDIGSILVVTFTKAATRELRERIRLRLQEAKEILEERENKNPQDAALVTWINDLKEKTKALSAIRQALSEIDQASIFTIHGFCQRTLTEYALESGQLFNTEVINSLDAMQQEISQDYWRCQLYPQSSFNVAALTWEVKSPQALLKSVKQIRMGTQILPKTREISIILSELNAKLTPQACDELMISVLTPLAQLIAKLKAAFAVKFVRDFHDFMDLFQRAQQNDFSQDFFTAFGQFNQDKFINGLKGKAKKEADFYQKRHIDIEKIAVIASLIKALNLAFRAHFLDYLHYELNQRQLTQNIISQNDIILRLDQALTKEEHPFLEQVIEQKYKVALIDEFQDTDQAQWSIFSTLFAKSSHYLYLIGDPKQAIYKFRGADIYSYLAAKEAAKRNYTLDTNYRSHPNLLKAINDLFAIENPFYIEDIPYNPVEAGKKDNTLYIKDDLAESFVFMHLLKSTYWTSGKAREAIRPAIVNEISHLLHYAHLHLNHKRPLKPQDIAILVRNNPEAKSYQQVLLDHKIPAICLDRNSVFESTEALPLYGILKAIENPTDLRQLKALLNLTWFNLNASAWLAIFNQEDQIDRWFFRLQQYREEWRKKGIISMMHHFFEAEGLQLNIAKAPRAERVLTNISHILELLQQFETQEKGGIRKSIQYFEQEMQADMEEAKEIRLESDRNAIQIITIHSAKGLEFPIVFCPDLWTPSRKPDKNYIVFHEPQGICADIGGDQFQTHANQAIKEEQAENSRLLYVALTRAKYRCYCVWANVRTKYKENDSALNHLLKQIKGEDYQEKFHNLESKGFQLLELTDQTEIKVDYHPEKSIQELKPRFSQRQFKQLWQMTSYTSLAYLSQHDAIEETPIDKAQEPILSISPETDLEEIEAELPRGAHTGNVVHELLENHDFNHLSHPDYLENNPDFIQDQQKTCDHFGLVLETPELLNTLLQKTVLTPLDSQDTAFTLASLSTEQCLKEMPFYFSAPHLDTLKINQALKGCPTFLPLDDKKIQGQLTGFIDLICEYQGQYYVMDYKTNALEDYNPAALESAMLAHNYGLQYWLYTLVLHHYLSQRIANYEYERHFGGVKYLFVRGMKPEQPASGVFSTRPLLQQLLDFEASIV